MDVHDGVQPRPRGGSNRERDFMDYRSSVYKKEKVDGDDVLSPA